MERVKSGLPTMEVSSAKRVVSGAVEEMSHLAGERNINLETNVEVDAKFLADPTQFQRALINLIENAIKFTLPGGTVNVSVTRDVEKDWIIFQVEDTGIGIPKDLQEFVFDRFFRGGQKGQRGAEHVSGSGLGLSLVKTIVDNHQGKVWLSSKEGEGTRVFISVPAVSEVHESRASHSQ